MSKGLIGKKVGMTTVFAEDGTSVPVTVVEAPRTWSSVTGRRSATDTRRSNSAIRSWTRRRRSAADKALSWTVQEEGQKPHKGIKEFRVEAKELTISPWAPR